MYDHVLFFASVRPSLFGGNLNASQVAGMEAILKAAPADMPMAHLAYCLATAKHETAGAMQPVIETRQPREDTNPSVDTAIARLERAWAAGKMPWVKKAYWRKDAAGKSWLGRGLPQCTHETNYLKMEKRLGVPFTAKPELMLEIEHAVPVMIVGMTEGLFTGHRLSEFFGPGRNNPKGARTIINGTESDDVVAGYHKGFLAALKAAFVAPKPSSFPATCPTCHQPVPKAG